MEELKGEGKEEGEEERPSEDKDVNKKEEKTLPNTGVGGVMGLGIISLLSLGVIIRREDR